MEVRGLVARGRWMLVGGAWTLTLASDAALDVGGAPGCLCFDALEVASDDMVWVKVACLRRWVRLIIND